MVERLVAEVPERIWAEGKAPRQQRWQAEFNVASWVRFSGPAGEAALLVCHEDDAGSHSQLVDRVSVSEASSSLMSGMIRMSFTGQVGAVEVVIKLSDAAMGFTVDELYVQRRGTELRRQDKLISNF